MTRKEAEAKYRFSERGQAKAVEGALKGRPWRPAIVECTVCKGWDNRAAMTKLGGKWDWEYICGPCLAIRLYQPSEPSDTFVFEQEVDEETFLAD